MATGGTTKRNILVLAALLGLITSLLVVKYLTDYREKTGEVMVPVVVATQEINTRTIIDPSMVAVRLLKHSVAPREAFSEEADVAGLVALRKIPRDSAIGQTDVAEKGSALGLAFSIPPFMRAVTVAVDPVIGVAGFLKPRDRVDVVATFDRGENAKAVTILQDVELLALGSQLEKERMKAEGQDKPSSMSSGSKDTATLLVTPEEAERLVLAENEGKLRLVLRSVQDAARVDSKGVSRNALTGAPAAKPSPASPKPAASRPVPSRPATVTTTERTVAARTAPAPAKKSEAPEPPKVEVIKGSKVESVEVESAN